MNTGLSFLDQIRNLQIPADPTIAGDVVDRTKSGGGGWIAEAFQRLVSALDTGYHTEHNADDSHGTIHASGSIAERGRSVAMGEWVPIALAATRFSGNGTMTWTVPTATSATGLRYMRIGTTMFVAWNLVATTVGGAVNTILQMTVHDTLTPLSVVSAIPFLYSDNGTPGIGMAQVVPGSPGSGTVIRLFINEGAATNWTASAAATNVRGQIAFEVTGT